MIHNGQEVLVGIMNYGQMMQKLNVIMIIILKTQPFSLCLLKNIMTAFILQELLLKTLILFYHFMKLMVKITMTLFLRKLLKKLGTFKLKLFMIEFTNILKDVKNLMLKDIFKFKFFVEMKMNK